MLLGSLLVNILLVHCEKDIIFNDVRKNTKISAYVITVVYTDSMVLCMQHCILQADCWSININSELKECNLLAEHFLCGTKSDGWNYYGARKVCIYRHENEHEFLNYIFKLA